MSTRAPATEPSYAASGGTAPHLAVGTSGSASSGIDLLWTLLRYFRLTVGVAVVLAVATAVQGLRQGRVYSAESAFVLDSEGGQSPASGLAAQFGIALPQTGQSQTPGFYADLLTSPTILRRVVDSAITVQTARGPVQLDLIDSVPGDAGDRAVRRQQAMMLLENRIGVATAQRTGVVTLRVVDRSPAVALALNRRLLDLLAEFNRERRRSQTSEQRQFVESRLAEARNELRNAEERLRRFLEANRAFVPSSEAYFQRQRLERDVMARSQLYESLLQSYEQARLEEFREAPLIGVIQHPELPATPEPRRTVRKTAVALLVGLVLGLFLAYVLESWRTFRARNPAFMQAVRGLFRRSAA